MSLLAVVGFHLFHHGKQVNLQRPAWGDLSQWNTIWLEKLTSDRHCDGLSYLKQVLKSMQVDFKPIMEMTQNPSLSLR